MNEQLHLIGSENRPWVIDPHTREVGREGLRQARAALARRRDPSQVQESPARPAAA